MVLQGRWLLLLCLLISFTGYAQNENVWAFGYKAGLDFSSGNPVAITTAIDGGTIGEANASVCDKNGQLLFYTEGSYVWTRQHTLMPNGSNITGMPPTNLPSVTTSSTQGALIVPMPGSKTRYYIFSLISAESDSAGYLYYSVVDMSLNGGMGDVMPGKKGIWLDSGLTEKMTSVIGNDCNLWVITHVRNQPVFKTWSIDVAGISNTPVVSTTGTTGLSYIVGTLKASVDGRKLMTSNNTGLERLEVYDFNQTTGVVSNAFIVDYGSYYAANFSPDGSKIYASPFNTSTLYQFDLNVPNPAKSIFLVSADQVFADIKLGPDGKLYMRSEDTKLSAIANPNALGAACDYRKNAVTLQPGTEIHSGLPNVITHLDIDTFLTHKAPITVCFKDTFRLTITGGKRNFEWDNGTTDSSRTVTQSGRYWVRYVQPPCLHYTDTFDITFFNTKFTTGAQKACKKTARPIWVTTAPTDTNIYTYTWRDAASTVLQTNTGKGGDTLHNATQGTYTVFVHNTIGCDTSFSIIIKEDYEVSFDADSTVCQGSNIMVQNTATPAATFASYTWLWGNGDSTIGAQPVYAYPKPGTYTISLVGTTVDGCLDTATKNMVVDTAAYLYFASSIGDSICAGSIVSFQPFYPTGLTSLVWNLGNGITTNSITPPTQVYDIAGDVIITLKATFRACADTTYQKTIKIEALPIANLRPDTTLCPGSGGILLQSLVKLPTYVYSWNTGATTPDISVTEPGIYTLTISTPNNCTAADTVAVAKSCYMQIPNIFSPNNDGVNDYFFPRSLSAKGIISFYMKIVNRWGQTVFETTDINGRGWDGRYNGVMQNEGVYIYGIDARFANGSEEHPQGNVTLLR